MSWAAEGTEGIQYFGFEIDRTEDLRWGIQICKDPGGEWDLVQQVVLTLQTDAVCSDLKQFCVKNFAKKNLTLHEDLWGGSA